MLREEAARARNFPGGKNKTSGLPAIAGAPLHWKISLGSNKMEPIWTEMQKSLIPFAFELDFYRAGGLDNYRIVFSGDFPPGHESKGDKRYLLGHTDRSHRTFRLCIEILFRVPSIAAASHLH